MAQLVQYIAFSINNDYLKKLTKMVKRSEGKAMINFFKAIYNSILEFIKKHDDFIKGLFWDALLQIVEKARDNQKDKNSD